MVKIIMFLIFVGLLGFGAFQYNKYLDKIYQAKQNVLKEKLAISQRTIKNIKSQKSKLENQLSMEYETVKQRLKAKYQVAEKEMLDKYGSLNKRKANLDAQALANKKDAMQREKALDMRAAKLAKREKNVQKKEKLVKRKLLNIKKIKYECNIFDLRNIEEAIKKFQKVSYATRSRVGLLCGFDPANRTIVNPASCIRATKDREKAKSLLSFIEKTSGNVKQGQSYMEFARMQRYRMQINMRN